MEQIAYFEFPPKKTYEPWKLGGFRTLIQKTDARARRLFIFIYLFKFAIEAHTIMTTMEM